MTERAQRHHQAPPVRGVHHVTVNVADLAAAEEWFARVLGLDRIATIEQDGFSRVLAADGANSVVLGINRHTGGPTAPFDELRIGLDHLALKVDDSDLEAWTAHLDAHGVAHSGIKTGARPGTRLVAFRGPDNLALEIYASR